MGLPEVSAVPQHCMQGLFVFTILTSNTFSARNIELAKPEGKMSC